MQGLAGKTVIVTGAGRGIGAAYAARLAADGVQVIVADITGDNAEDVAKGIRADGGTAIAVASDITDESSVAGLIDATEKEFGQLDGVVNNAGLYYGIGWNPTQEIAGDTWDRMMEINVKGTWQVAKAAFPLLAKNPGGGRIVNIGSTTAFLAPPGLSHYVTSKAALVGLTRSLAKEFGPSNVTVNLLAPGGVWNEATSILVGDNDEIKAASIGGQAIARALMPEHLVGTVAFLLSDEAAMMTGQVIVVDGGFSLY